MTEKYRSVKLPYSFLFSVREPRLRSRIALSDRLKLAGDVAMSPIMAYR